jgi:hypothetical protein
LSTPEVLFVFPEVLILRGTMQSLHTILFGKAVKPVGVVAIAGFAFTASAATTINVDIKSSDGTVGIYSGVAAAPDSGTTWNAFRPGPEAGAPLVGSATSGALVTSTGAASSVTVTLGNFRVYEANENVAGLANPLMTDFVYQQTLGPGGPNSTFSINNLDPLSSYDIYFYGQNGGYANTATVFAIGATSLTATNATNAVTTFTAGVNYVKFTGIAPNGTGVISGTFNDAAAANNAAFTGLQIVQVPEASTVTLAGLASGLLLVRRRR